MAPGFSFAYAFEPDGMAFEHIKELGTELTNVWFFPFAVSDNNGTGTLVQGASSDVSAMATNAAACTPVQTCTLDALIPDYPTPISVIKIDTEGHELVVLAGADSLISRDRPTILLETPVSAAIIDWAERRRYLVGAACIPGNGTGPSFRWFNKPDPVHVKMVLLAPEENAARLREITKELYGRPAQYRRDLKKFQARTLKLWNAVP
jgi:FkbM family methyltransferase